MESSKKVNISLDTSKLAELDNRAKELANSMISDARKFSASSKMVVADIEEQIKLIEKRNRMAAEIDKTNVQRQFESGQISPQQYKQASSTQRFDTVQDKLLLDKVREIIDTIKETSKNEIREDRKMVEKEINENKKNIESLNPEGDAENNLKQTIQREMLPNVRGEENTEKRNWSQYTRNSTQLFSTAANSSDAYSGSLNTVAAAAAMGGVYGQVASEVLKVLAGTLEKSGQMEAQSSRLGIYTGFGSSAAIGFAQNLPTAGYGVNQAGAVERYSDYYKAGQRKIEGDEFRRYLSAESNMGLEKSQITQTVGIGRYSGTDMSQVMLRFETYLKNSNQNISLLPEILQTYSSVANQLLAVSTHVDVSRVAENITSIGNVTGAKGTDLNQWASGISSIGKGGNKVADSMFLQMLHKQNPTKSLYELQAMMERPEENMEAVGDIFKQLERSGMKGDVLRRAQEKILGGRVSKTNILANQGKLSGLGYQTTEVGEGEAVSSRMNASPQTFVGDQEASKKFFDELKEDVGKWSVDTMNSIASFFSSADYQKTQRLNITAGMVDAMNQAKRDPTQPN